MCPIPLKCKKKKKISQEERNQPVLPSYSTVLYKHDKKQVHFVRSSVPEAEVTGLIFRWIVSPISHGLNGAPSLPPALTMRALDHKQE